MSRTRRKAGGDGMALAHVGREPQQSHPQLLGQAGDATGVGRRVAVVDEQDVADPASDVPDQRGVRRFALAGDEGRDAARVERSRPRAVLYVARKRQRMRWLAHAALRPIASPSAAPASTSRP